MRETLYIRLRSTAPSSSVEYCIASAETRRAWAVECAPLEVVLAQATGRRVVVLVPGEDIRLDQLDLPVKQAAKAALAAPFALEESLAEDVDDLHFAVGARQAGGGFPVAVVRHSLMAHWLAPLREAGIRPQLMMPETLALPAPEPGWWHALVEPERLLVRHEAWGAFSGTASDLPLLLDLADPDRQQGVRLILAAVTGDYTGLERPTELRSGFQHGLEALLQHLPERPAINLLQGRYSQQADLQRLWRPWRVPAAMAAALVTAILAEHGLATVRLSEQARSQEARNVARFQQLFPSETRIVDLGAQAEQQLQRLQQAGQGGGLLSLTGTLEQALRKVEGLRLQGLQYREGALFASLSGNALSQLEALRGEFSQRSDVALEVQSANSGSDGVQIRIRISPA